MLVACTIAAVAPPRRTAGSDITFLSDDQTFAFSLPPRWVPATKPDDERAAGEHLISVRAQQMDGAASMQAIVDGGVRGRRYGSSLADLGPLDAIAQKLVSEELLNNVEAKSANVISAERVNINGRYYLIRYMLDFKLELSPVPGIEVHHYVSHPQAHR